MALRNEQAGRLRMVPDHPASSYPAPIEPIEALQAGRRWFLRFLQWFLSSDEVCGIVCFFTILQWLLSSDESSVSRHSLKHAHNFGSNLRSDNEALVKA